ncbi:hypothetical protein R3P38DRAFT_3187628 [Favolaschia claudopus]|uniref:Uncharacterized protein n=1 Tax=Favolaschia claudopus TaxID=2862362 RepID=A0AAW0C1S3_9AGAR
MPPPSSTSVLAMLPKQTPPLPRIDSLLLDTPTAYRFETFHSTGAVSATASQQRSERHRLSTAPLLFVSKCSISQPAVETGHLRYFAALRAPAATTPPSPTSKSKASAIPSGDRTWTSTRPRQNNFVFALATLYDSHVLYILRTSPTSLPGAKIRSPPPIQHVVYQAAGQESTVSPLLSPRQPLLHPDIVPGSHDVQEATFVNRFGLAHGNVLSEFDPDIVHAEDFNDSKRDFREVSIPSPLLPSVPSQLTNTLNLAATLARESVANTILAYSELIPSLASTSPSRTIRRRLFPFKLADAANAVLPALDRCGVARSLRPRAVALTGHITLPRAGLQFRLTAGKYPPRRVEQRVPRRLRCCCCRCPAAQRRTQVDTWDADPLRRVAPSKHD